jgi:hypothetical protein
MKKILLLAILAFCCVCPAQVVGPGFINYVTSAPSGTCSQGVPAQIVMGTGDIYTCQTGTWAKAGGSGAGAVTSVFGRTGAVVAVASDYGLGLIGNPAGGTTFTYATNQHSGWVLSGTGAFDITGPLTVSGNITPAVLSASVPVCTDASKNLTSTCPSAILRCYPGLGDGLNAITAGTYLQTNCYNNSGVTWTITRIGCFTDNAGTSTLAATNGAGTALLTGAVTCTAAAGGAAGTQSATVTIASTDVIKFTFVADGTSKQTGWFVTLTQ